MACDQTPRGFGVLMLAPAFREHVLLLRLQKRELPDFRQIAGEAAFALKRRHAATAHNSLTPSGVSRAQARTKPTAYLGTPVNAVRSAGDIRSEERRVGKECRSRSTGYQYKIIARSR